MEKGDEFENQLFTICEEAKISSNQLKMLGYKQTFAKHCPRSQARVRFKGAEEYKKEATKNKKHFLGLKKGMLRVEATVLRDKNITRQ